MVKEVMMFLFLIMANFPHDMKIGNVNCAKVLAKSHLNFMKIYNGGAGDDCI
jgi:hypothetical protein